MKSGFLISLLTAALLFAMGAIGYFIITIVPAALETGYAEAEADFAQERQRLLHSAALARKDAGVDSMALLAARHETEDCREALAAQTKLTKEADLKANVWKKDARRKAFSRDSALYLLGSTRAVVSDQEKTLDSTAILLANERNVTTSLRATLVDTMKSLNRERRLRDVAEKYAHEMRVKLLSRPVKPALFPPVVPAMIKTKPFSFKYDSVSGKSQIDPHISGSHPLLPQPMVDKTSYWGFYWLGFLLICMAMLLVWRWWLLKVEKREQRKKLREKLAPKALREKEVPPACITLPRELFFEDE